MKWTIKDVFLGMQVSRSQNVRLRFRLPFWLGLAANSVLTCMPRVDDGSEAAQARLSTTKDVIHGLPIHSKG